MPLVDQPSHLAVQTMFRGELCAASVAELWDVEGFEAVSIAEVVRELLLREGGAIFVRWHGCEPGSTLLRSLHSICLGARRALKDSGDFELLGFFSIFAPLLASAGHLSLVLSDVDVQALLERGNQVLTGSARRLVRLGLKSCGVWDAHPCLLDLVSKQGRKLPIVVQWDIKQSG